jgi:hypothetical protein
MMEDIVLVPTFARPEYLQLCLEHLAAADGGADKIVSVSHDRHTNDPGHIRNEVHLSKEITKRFEGKFKHIQFIEKDPHPYIGNPCNFLDLYKGAFIRQPFFRYIYLVEDDVLVAKDFFKWHEAVQARGDYFITVGWHCIRNPEVKQSTDPTAYIESTRDFSSIGICWKRDKLGAMVKHAVKEYYQSHRVYLTKAFPGSPINPGTWTEQAGIVTRLLHETKNRWVAWPSLSRVAHVGISGYHRPGGYRFSGPIEKRIEDLRAATKDSKVLNALSKDPFDDVASLSHIPEWNVEDLHVVQKFPYVHGKI